MNVLNTFWLYKTDHCHIKTHAVKQQRQKTKHTQTHTLTQSAENQQDWTLQMNKRCMIGNSYWTRTSQNKPHQGGDSERRNDSFDSRSHLPSYPCNGTCSRTTPLSQLLLTCRSAHLCKSEGEWQLGTERGGSPQWWKRKAQPLDWWSSPLPWQRRLDYILYIEEVDLLKGYWTFLTYLELRRCLHFGSPNHFLLQTVFSFGLKIHLRQLI